MLKNFENWLLEQKYSVLTSSDYTGRIERLCRNNKYTVEHLIKNISVILPEYEKNGKKQQRLWIKNFLKTNLSRAKLF